MEAWKGRAESCKEGEEKLCEEVENLYEEVGKYYAESRQSTHYRNAFGSLFVIR